jgi:hypothetical protein
VPHIPFWDELLNEAGRVAVDEPVQSKLFLEEDMATSPTLASFQRVYVGWERIWSYSEGVVAVWLPFHHQGSLAGTDFPVCEVWPVVNNRVAQGMPHGCEGCGLR